MGFAQIHQAILALAAKTVAKGRFQASVVPINETEEMETTMDAPGKESVSVSYQNAQLHLQGTTKAAVYSRRSWKLQLSSCRGGYWYIWCA